MASLKNIAEFIEISSDDCSSFLNITTGEVLFIENRFLGMAEDGEVLDEFDGEEEKDSLIIATDILENHTKYIKLPDKHEFHEYSMMNQFAQNYPKNKIRNLLQRAISGKGAFRRFKDTVIEFKIKKEWYEFKDKEYLVIAKDWCENKNISYEN